MTTTLRVILEEPAVHPSDDVLAASIELTRALIAQAPQRCDVAAVVPSGSGPVEQILPGLSGVKTVSLARRELLAAWRLGVGPSAGGGLVHSPTLAAPLHRHDRTETGDQVVVTLWDLDAWDDPDALSKGAVTWQRAMMRRAERHADAIVVPTFEHARRVAEEWGIGDRLRVVAGAAAEGFGVPSDVDARRRDLSLPQSYAVVDGSSRVLDGLGPAFAALKPHLDDERRIVVISAPEGDEVNIRELASIAGIDQQHVIVLPRLAAADRAVVLDGALLLVAAQTRVAWPWRVVESLALGTPVVALDGPILREVLGDDGMLASSDALSSLVGDVLGGRREIARALSADRGRAFSWESSADLVWQLHAEL